MDFGGQQQGFIHVSLSKEEKKEIKVYVWDSTTFWSNKDKDKEKKEEEKKE